MRTNNQKKVRNGTLVFFFFLLVVVAILVSIVVKTVLLITHSTFDNKHQFILEIKGTSPEEELISFFPGTNTVSILFVDGLQHGGIQALQIPVDGTYALAESVKAHPLSAQLSGMIMRCHAPVCQHLNRVDAIKFWWFVNHLKPSAIEQASITLPISQEAFKTTLQPLFVDETLYHEALSIAIINASGQVGLGNALSQLLTNIGGNVVAVTSGDIQSQTTMESSYGKTSYTIYRLQDILHLVSQPMQGAGLSDVVITIGEKHPGL